MKLKDFLQDIALGDLQGSTMVEMGGYQITQKHIPVVIQALNQALDYLYSIFPIKDSQVTIQLREGINRYYLDSHYSVSGHHPQPYIMDTEFEPFQDDVLAVQEVFDDKGQRIPLNDDYSPYGVTTPEYNCIQTSDGTHYSKYLTVMYRAKHPRIPLNEPLDSKLTIQLPTSYNGALQAYVASLVYQSMGGNEAQVGNFYYGKFRTLIEDLKAQGVGYKSTTGVNIKPILGGWL